MKNHATTDAVWTITGALATSRTLHTATALANGKILVVGGNGKHEARLERLNSAELYDGATGTWSQTGSLRAARIVHTATLLPNGKVLVTGGVSSIEHPDSIDAAELYDPATGEWTATGNLKDARSSHTAILLHSGLVLVAGGIEAGGHGDRLNSAELYDPATGEWTATGHLTLENGRASHTATLLDNGMVLIVGGQTSGPFMANGAELYDPVKGDWVATGSPSTVRVEHTATLLRDGKVLLAGGVRSNGLADELDSAEIYDPIEKVFAATGSLNTARQQHTATLLRDGKVLVAGGFRDVVTGGITRRPPLKVAELYDPSQERWSVTADLREARGRQTAALLEHGTVLVAGGQKADDDGFVPLDRAELFWQGDVNKKL